MTSNTRPTENLQDIHRQLAEAQQQLGAINMLPGERFIDFEYRVKSHIDKILALKIADLFRRFRRGRGIVGF